MRDMVHVIMYDVNDDDIMMVVMVVGLMMTKAMMRMMTMAMIHWKQDIFFVTDQSYN